MPSAENSPRLAQTVNSVSLVWLSNQIYIADSDKKKENPCKYRGLMHEKDLGEMTVLA